MFVLALVHGGETVLPTHKRDGSEFGMREGDVIINLHDVTIRRDDDIVQLARELERERRIQRLSRGEQI